MKNIFYLFVYFLAHSAKSQLTITQGAQWVNKGNVTVVISNMDLINNGTFSAGNSTIKFTGSSMNKIGGSSPTTFYILEIAKSGNNKINLLSDIHVGQQVNFISGILDLDQKNLTLDSTAFLNNENENNRIIGSDSGKVIITLNLNAPDNANPGNLGAIIKSVSDLGTITLERGHKMQSGTGLDSSILRFYNIMPANNIGLNATLRFKYFDKELNSQNEESLVMFRSTDNAVTWSNLFYNNRDTVNNYVEKTGIDSFALFTVSRDNALPVPPPATVPVTGLVFNAKRKKPTEVELGWSTATETNMNGFEVQRRLDNEADFSARAFVNSKAAGGNSNSQLSYLHIDPNSYAGISYYRLKIVDLNNAISYSEIRSVSGKGKKGNGNNNIREAGTEGNSESVSVKGMMPTGTPVIKKITVGPNPNNGNFWFIVSGIEKETSATLYTIDGKILKQCRVFNLTQYHVNGLQGGMYLLKVPGMDAFRIIVQGGNNPGVNNRATTSPLIKN